MISPWDTKLVLRLHSHIQLLPGPFQCRHPIQGEGVDPAIAVEAAPGSPICWHGQGFEFPVCTVADTRQDRIMRLEESLDTSPVAPIRRPQFWADGIGESDSSRYQPIECRVCAEGSAQLLCERLGLARHARNDKRFGLYAVFGAHEVGGAESPVSCAYRETHA